MLSSYFDTIMIVEWLAFIAAIFLLNKKTGIWRLFILYMFITLCTETFGWYMNVVLKEKMNAIPFNIFLLISQPFLLLVIAHAPLLKSIRKFTSIGIIFFSLGGIINLLFFQKWQVYDAYTETFGDVMLILICLYFLLNTLQEEEYRDLVKYDYFWLIVGVLFSSLGTALLYLFPEKLTFFYSQTKINLGSIINTVINLIFYFSLIIAFLCRRIALK